MTQTKIRLRSNPKAKYVPEFAEAVGLSCEDQVVTLRFIDNASWGGGSRQVRIDKRVAEQLLRLLNDELEDASWSY